ncbi:PAS domain S-box protein [Halomicroarcula sp. F13]|uniref:histidine kinase n=1 Tax=Haloarcula rubra TaxID=2487747 RepID=A0AAW4PKZ7_9EURY|nr:PAS domain S-box protein [Halomicroarcula rubra]MBX0321406.1 PAS domain S-box protein [Halomicroarcula rubra]
MAAGDIHVLHVDDDPSITDLAATMLERDSDIRVTTRNDPEAVLDRFEAAEFDCVVSDYEMPEMDGLELYERLSGQFDHADFPYILFTGRGSESIAADALNAGVTGYLQKGGPEQYDLLANRVHNATDQYRAQVKADRYETVIDALDYPVYVVDERGTFRFVNEPFAAMTGYDRAEILGQPTSFVKPEETVQRAEDVLGQLLSSSGPDTARFRATIETASGDLVDCRDHMGVLPYEGESFRGSVGILRVSDEVPPPATDGGRVSEPGRGGDHVPKDRLLDALSDPVFALDEDGEFVYANDRVGELVGRDPDAIPGTHYSEFAVPVGGSGDCDLFVDLSDADDVDRFAAEQSVLVDGETVTVEGRPATLQGPEAVFVGTVRDRSDRQRATDRYRALFDNLPDPTVVTDFDDGEPRIRRANGAFERVFGYDAEAVVGESVNDLLVPDGHADGAAEIDRAVLNGERVSREVRRETADGDQRDFLFRNVPIEHDDGEVLAYGVYTDITERTAYEERLTALHETARRLMTAESTDEVLDIGLRAARDILGHDINAIHLYDEATGGLVPVATTECTDELFGEVPTFTEGDSIAWRAFERGEAVVREDVREDADVLNPETPVRSEMVLPLGDRGILLPASTEPGAFDDADRSLGNVLAANIQSALQQVEREQTLRDREQALARQNERLDEFASIVSHDLRTPLDLAAVHLELATEGEGDADREHLDRVAAAHDRMSDLVSDVLAWAREGVTVEDTEPVSIPDLVTDCWMGIQAESASLSVTTDRTVEADRDRLRRVFENLLGNAVAHGGDGPTIRVGDLDDAAGIFLEDDGPGIPEDERDDVFTSGYTHSEGGNGFGLAIVEQIVEAHGWEIRVTDGAAGGARFEITGFEE